MADAADATGSADPSRPAAEPHSGPGAGPGLTVRSGIDLVFVPRLSRLLESQDGPFLRAVWTTAELVHCDGRAERLAVRWAAKEATLKALGRGMDVVPLRHVEVEVDAAGAPHLVLTGVALREARAQGWVQWSVSMSHDGDYAVASVVALASLSPGG